MTGVLKHMFGRCVGGGKAEIIAKVLSLPERCAIREALIARYLLYI